MKVKFFQEGGQMAPEGAPMGPEQGMEPGMEEGAPQEGGASMEEQLMQLTQQIVQEM